MNLRAVDRPVLNRERSMVGSGKGVAVGLLIALSVAGGTAALAAAEKGGPPAAPTA
jgi:hypothetical protein